MATILDATLDHAQQFCDDPVVAVAPFRPNAEGEHELRSIRGISQRQLLKGRSAYLAERMLLAVSTVEVVAVAVGFAAFRWPRVRRWRRADLRVSKVPLRADRFAEGRVALLLNRVDGGPRLEIAPVRIDQATHRVLELLGCSTTGT